MIAAVVHPRGADAAQGALARLRAGDAGWVETRGRGGAVVASSASADEALYLSQPRSLSVAAQQPGTGAFVAIDADAPDAVVLGRGSLGGRSLYYTRDKEGAWLACSRVEPLLGAAGRSFGPDPDRLAAIAAGVAHTVPDATPFRGIARVVPCTAVRLSAAGAVTEERPIEEREPIAGVSVADLAAEMWRRLERSVRRSVGDARSVAVMVGGGVDSSGLLAAVLADARGATKREVTALALDFDALGSDRAYLADLARDLGIVPVRLSPRDAAPWYASSFVLDEQPYYLAIGPMERLVFGRARDAGAEMLLSGYFADDVLAGDLRCMATEALDGAPLRAAKRAARLKLPWDTSARGRIQSYVVRPLLRPFVPRPFLRAKMARQDRHDYPWAGPRMRRVLAAIRAGVAASRPPRTPRERFDRYARSVLFADLADCRSQIESATGLVRKDPYVDEDILDLVSRAPPPALVHGDLYRGLFREALRGKIPESVRLRSDKSWFEPAFAAVAAAAGGFEVLGDAWQPRALEALDIVDAACFRKAMEPLFANPSSSTTAAWPWSAATQVIGCEQFARRRGGVS